jgi:intracellular multiplication protein IcmP
MSGKAEEDPTWHLLFVFVFVFGAGWLVWHFFKAPLLEAMRYVRFAELSVIGLFNERAAACASWIWSANVGEGIPSVAVAGKAANCFGRDELLRLPPQASTMFYNITPTSLGYVTKYLVAPYMRWFAVAVLAAAAIFAMFFTKRNKFKTRYNLENFIKIQAKMWPVISPIVNFNPTKHSARAPGEPIPDKLPTFAEAMSPEEWLSFHRIPVTNGIPDREMVRRAFLLQLGPRWQGAESLPPHMLCLFAAFALRGAQKREECEDLLGRIALCWSQENGLILTPQILEEVRSIARNPEVGGKASEYASKHAYRTTALLGVLRWARFMGGVLAPAQFLWLRGEDRNLWYPMNNLGRRSFHTEGSGAMAHFMAEQAAKKPLVMPRLETAIVALNQYLADTGAKIPPRENSTNQKRIG